MEEKKSTRINKYLSEVGYCSRRAADKLIEQGKVTINGIVPEMGTKIVQGDEQKSDVKVQQTYTEHIPETELSFDMVLLSEGTFMMGSPENEAEQTTVQ